ncbi:MAG: response regulator [Acidobacteriia bacterium]|nr:response regulator [Terriglobia bacterium]
MTQPDMLSLFDYLCNEARNAVHASFGLMEFRPAEGDRAWRTCADATRSSAERLLRVIDDMRELLANEPAAVQSPEDFDLPLCVGETIELLNLAFSGRGSRLVLEASAPLAIRQNRPALEQVLTRILNAVAKLARSGIVRITVGGSADGAARVGIAPPNPDLALRLADALNADLAHLKFGDVDEVAWMVPLLVAARRLQALGGTAEFVCDSGSPTGLALFFPSETEPSTDAPPRPDSQLNALNILVAEDSDESFALTQLLLRNEAVERARTGLEAIDLVKKQRFDLVLMDVHMPGLDGYRAIRAIREWETRTTNARTPIVVLSSDDLARQAQEAAQSGCSGFLRKPLRTTDVFDLLDRLRGARELTS